MNHPHEDQLLLLAYDELPTADAAGLEAHLATCAACRDDLARLARARVALDWTAPKPRSARWLVAGLAAAAAVAAILLTGRPSSDEPRSGGGWLEQRPWSATAGYIAGGQPLIAIDAQLTRLEQERSYARP